MEDLKKRSNSHDEYEVMMIAALLRKLLMDSDPLMNQINRSLKLKIRFTINNISLTSKPPIPIFESVEDGFDPETSPPFLINIKDVTVDQLLKTDIIQYHGNRINVGELIHHMAHIEGAIHPGSPREEKEKSMKELVETIGIGGLPAGIRILKAITRVVLKGLSELELQIAN